MILPVSHPRAEPMGPPDLPSLTELIASGRTMVKAPDRETARRLREMAAERLRVREMRRVIESRQEALASEFADAVNRTGASDRIASVTWPEGEDSQPGLLVDAERGIVVTGVPPVAWEERVLVSIGDEGLLWARAIWLSRTEGVVAVVVDDWSTHRSRFTGLPPLAASPSSPAPGRMISGFSAGSRPLTGTLTAMRHRGEEFSSNRVRDSLDRHWETLGLQVSERRSGFEEALVSDLALPNGKTGYPVFLLDGEWIGIAVARTDLHETVVIPAERIRSLLPGSKPG